MEHNRERFRNTEGCDRENCARLIVVVRPSVRLLLEYPGVDGSGMCDGCRSPVSAPPQAVLRLTAFVVPFSVVPCFIPAT